MKPRFLEIKKIIFIYTWRYKKQKNYGKIIY